MSEQNKSDQKMHDALKRTVRHVVETMCFSEVAPTDESWQNNAETIVTAVNFYGSRSGRLQLEVSSSAAWSLRDAFLGECEQRRGKGSAGQMVEELGTMICGRFLSSVDPLSQMSLRASGIGQQSAASGDTAPKRVRQGFLLDSGHLTASVEFDNEKLG